MTDSQTTTTTNCNAKLMLEKVIRPEKRKIGQADDQIVYELRHPAWSLSFHTATGILAVCYGAPDPCIRIFDYNIKNNSWDCTAKLCGIQTRTVRNIQFAPTPRKLILAACSFDGTICIWEQQETSTKHAKHNNWECTTQLEGHDNECKDVAWNGTGSLLATCGRDKTVWMWESFLDGTVGGHATNDFECIAVLNGHSADVKTVIFGCSHGIGDGEEICLSGSYDETIRVWAEEDSEWYCHAVLNCSSTVWKLTLSPSSTRLIAALDDGDLCIFYLESRSWKSVGKLGAAHDTDPVYGISYAPAKLGHGRLVSCGGDGTLQVYREVLESTPNRPMFLVDAHYSLECDLHAVAWHPFVSECLVCAREDGTVCVFQYKTS